MLEDGRKLSYAVGIAIIRKAKTMNRLSILTAALLGSALSAFRPFEGTNAGGKLYVCATPQANNLDRTGFEALTWVEVKGVGSVGEMGVNTNILTYDTWGDDVVRKQKGMSNAGDPPVEVARIPADAGQIILRAAAKTKLNYALKIVKDDATIVGGVGTTIYNRGLVTGPTRPMGRNEDFDLEVFTFGLQQLEILVDPVTGNAPLNTDLPTITGIAEVGETLTAVVGTWVGDATITYAYQWRVNGVAKAGATGAIYVVVPDDLGKYVSVAETATNSAGQNTAFSAPTAAIAA